MAAAHRTPVRIAIAACSLAMIACVSGPPPVGQSPTPSASVTASAEPSDTPEARYVEVTASSCLNIRAQPSLEAAVIGCAPVGTILTRVGGPREGDGRQWLKVAGAWEGWAAAEFLQATDEAPPEP